MSAREEILARSRQAASVERVVAAAEARWTYRLYADATIEEFVARLQRYDASANRVMATQLDAAVVGTLAARGARRVVAPHGIPESWLAGIRADARRSATRAAGA